MNVKKVIFDLGGTGYVAKKLNVQPSTVSNWKKNNKIPNVYYNDIHLLKNEISALNDQLNRMQYNSNSDKVSNRELFPLFSLVKTKKLN